MVNFYRSDPRTSSNTSEGSDDDEEILGSDDDEQEDPRDYCKGKKENNKIGEKFCWKTWKNP